MVAEIGTFMGRHSTGRENFTRNVLWGKIHSPTRRTFVFRWLAWIH